MVMHIRLLFLSACYYLCTHIVSRDMLTSALSSATDMANSEVIMAALHTLAISLFTTDTLAKPMNPTSLTTFLRSVQQGCLPSSSAQTNVSYFEQVLIDMIWAVEFSMEEAAASLKADDTKQASGPSRAETDKVVLVQFAQQLLVCHSCGVSCSRSLIKRPDRGPHHGTTMQGEVRSPVVR